MLRLSCVVHEPIYGRFLGCTVNGFLTSLRGRRSKGKGKGIRARDHAHALSSAQIQPSPFPFNACHAGYFLTIITHTRGGRQSLAPVVLFLGY